MAVGDNQARVRGHDEYFLAAAEGRLAESEARGVPVDAISDNAELPAEIQRSMAEEMYAAMADFPPPFGMGAHPRVT